MQFSVLISVYRKENPLFLDKALESIEDQTLLANEIVLVKDGLLTSDLDRVIAHRIEQSEIVYKIIELKENVGLGRALNEGLHHCSYAWAARMDSDDVSLPERFEKQFDYLRKHPGIDILGSWICEFDEVPDNYKYERRVPVSHKDIAKFAKYRNPMNHMTVLFRKKAIEEVGGYLPMNGFEDYFLWMRMLAQGKTFANHPEVLVAARTGRDMIRRRQGWEYAKKEWTLEKNAYKIGFWSKVDIARNFFTRFLPRLLPVYAVERLYNVLRRH